MNFIVAVLIIIQFNSVFAEPQPWGIIVKDSSCSAYWPGDECTYYKLPQGWIELAGETIKHKGKICKFTLGQEKKCCEQLGLRYVEMKLEKDLKQKLPEICNKELSSPIATKQSFQSCHKDSDCALTEPCCSTKAVNRKFLKQFWKNKDCSTLDCETTKAKCTNGLCAVF